MLNFRGDQSPLSTPWIHTWNYLFFYTLPPSSVICTFQVSNLWIRKLKMLQVQTKVHSNVRFRPDVDSSFDPMSNSNCFYCGKSDVFTSFFSVFYITIIVKPKYIVKFLLLWYGSPWLTHLPFSIFTLTSFL